MKFLHSSFLLPLILAASLLPAAAAFGIWGLFVGQVGIALSVVTGMTLGIVVDDTVHFMSKYLRARREKGFNAEQAVHYAFNSVGIALLVTSVVLIAGFMIMAQSHFELNAGMGLLLEFIDHLRDERQLSANTVAAYQSDLAGFFGFEPPPFRFFSCRGLPPDPSAFFPRRERAILFRPGSTSSTVTVTV